MIRLIGRFAATQNLRIVRLVVRPPQHFTRVLDHLSFVTGLGRLDALGGGLRLLLRLCHELVVQIVVVGVLQLLAATTQIASCFARCAAPLFIQLSFELVLLSLMEIILLLAEVVLWAIAGDD